LYRNNKSTFQDTALKQLVGTVVLTRYNNRTYRVDDIAWDKNPQSTFMDHTGKAVSFVDYYKKAYDKTIMDKEQPLLLHRPKRRDKLNKDAPDEVICLIPELCCMTGLTDYARSDFRVMKDIAAHTRVSPSAREKAFRSFVTRMKATPKAIEELDGWGISLDSGLTELSGSQAGRRLPMEKVLFRNKTILAGDDADWSRDAVKEQQIVAVPLRQWVVVVTKRDRSKAVEFVNMMKRVAPPMGIEVQDARIVEVVNDRTDTYLQAIRPQITPQLQLVVIVFPTSRDDRYAAVKKLCCIEKPIPSQVINARTISAQQKLRSVSQKIALQINCKLGGELWALSIPVKNLMIVGIDVFHDAVLGKSRSITGFVASTNPHMTRWYSRVAIQGPQQELVDGLKLCFRAALQKYHQENGGLPERIIVYRDGVGDGMMHTVAQYEVPQMTSCFTDLFGESYQPKMAVVVVQKRISTRIFCRSPRTGLDNPPPGTVVDHTITRRGIYDFFLVSQKVRQGTVTPTHYTVVHDSSTLKPDHMQRMAYKMTHMYYNWPGTIRVPAPCQYAHKLAFLVGQSLHKDPALELADRLFFL
jgi:aubergine-like protein